MLDSKKISSLISFANKAMERAYAPYSGYKVGAALLCDNGRIYLGCNIENAAFTPTCCAERTAYFKAISDGEKHFKAIAVVGGKDGVIEDFAEPCGVCRQVIREFCEDDFTVIMGGKDGEYKVRTLKELLPDSFKPDKVK